MLIGILTENPKGGELSSINYVDCVPEGFPDRVFRSKFIMWIIGQAAWFANLWQEDGPREKERASERAKLLDI